MHAEKTPYSYALNDRHYSCCSNPASLQHLSNTDWFLAGAERTVTPPVLYGPLAFSLCLFSFLIGVIQNTNYSLSVSLSFCLCLSVSLSVSFSLSHMQSITDYTLERFGVLVVKTHQSHLFALSTDGLLSIFSLLKSSTLTTQDYKTFDKMTSSPLSLH